MKPITDYFQIDHKSFNDRAKALDDAVSSLDISPSVLRLLGTALPAKGKVEEIEDDRLKYILSK